MVLELHLRNRRWIPTLKNLALCVCVLLSLQARSVRADDAAGADALREAQNYYRSGQYFRSARYAFAATETPSLEPEAYSWVTLSLVRAGLYNAASYFFVKTLQTGNKPAIRRVLGDTQELLVRVGGDVLRKYLIRHTAYDDYDLVNRSAYLYSLGKDTLLDGKEERAIAYFNGISPKSALWPFVLQLRGTALAILGRGDEAIRDFRACSASASNYVTSAEGFHRRQQERESEDLAARCKAGEARTLYQQNKFADADRAYDSIPKASFVWPDILFEQAWNAFGRQEYNRTLGKLVSYKSPALSFVFNSEIDVLRAQSYLLLCLYGDANDVINEFNTKYAKMSTDVRRFVDSNGSNLSAFYEAGKSALGGPLHTRNDFHRLLNRFVRGPYFQNLVASEVAVASEQAAIARFALTQSAGSHDIGQGFPGFLEQVLKWRLTTIKNLGGAFVKNSLIDYHKDLLADFDKIAFIKLEMLSRAKDKLLSRSTGGSSRARGNIEPTRRDDQYRWSFNGEFWTDELGDYVFGLESECGKG